MWMDERKKNSSNIMVKRISCTIFKSIHEKIKSVVHIHPSSDLRTCQSNALTDIFIRIYDNRWMDGWIAFQQEPFFAL